MKLLAASPLRGATRPSNSQPIIVSEDRSVKKSSRDTDDRVSHVPSGTAIAISVSTKAFPFCGTVVAFEA